MKKMKMFWLFNAVVIALFFFALSAVAQVSAGDAMEMRTETTGRPDRGDIVPLDARGDLPSMEPVEMMPGMHMHGGDGVPPSMPGEAMATDSRDIYIYVTLLAPVGPEPPDSVQIIAKNCTDGAEKVEFKVDLAPTGYFGSYFSVYRDTLPLFFMSQLDTTRAHGNLIGRTVTRFFNDEFLDTLWPGYGTGGSKGVCDTLVNLFYVFTTVDTTATAPDGYSESAYPSWCLAEYDQPIYASTVYGTRNYWSIPNVDIRFEKCSDLHDIGIRQVTEWNPLTQTNTVRGVYNVGLSRWLPDGPIRVGHVYQVIGDYGAMIARPSEYEYFQTYKPGIIPSTDSSFTMAYSSDYGGANIVMLPFKASVVEGINNRATLVSSIQEAGILYGIEVYRIDAWNGTSFSWSPIALKITPVVWNANPYIRPGKPIRVWIRRTETGTVTFPWPIS